jgi:hypothetical protein
MGCYFESSVLNESKMKAHIEDGLLHLPYLASKMKRMYEELFDVENGVQKRIHLEVAKALCPPPLLSTHPSALTHPPEEKPVCFSWNFNPDESIKEMSSPVLCKAFGGSWGISYGHRESKETEISIYIFCMELSTPILLYYSISLLHPLTGKVIYHTYSEHYWLTCQHVGQRCVKTWKELQDTEVHNLYHALWLCDAVYLQKDFRSNQNGRAQKIF